MIIPDKRSFTEIVVHFNRLVLVQNTNISWSSLSVPRFVQFLCALASERAFCFDVPYCHMHCPLPSPLATSTTRDGKYFQRNCIDQWSAYIDVKMFQFSNWWSCSNSISDETWWRRWPLQLLSKWTECNITIYRIWMKNDELTGNGCHRHRWWQELVSFADRTKLPSRIHERTHLLCSSTVMRLQDVDLHFGCQNVFLSRRQFVAHFHSHFS